MDDHAELETYPAMRRRHIAEIHELIRRALVRCDGDRSAAARLIGMDRGAMKRRIRECALDVPPPKRAHQ